MHANRKTGIEIRDAIMLQLNCIEHASCKNNSILHDSFFEKRNSMPVEIWYLHLAQKNNQNINRIYMIITRYIYSEGLRN